VPDARNLRGLLDDELAQRQQSGYAVNDRLTKQIRAAVSDETATSLEIAELYDQLDHTTLRADWDHDEPSALENILPAAPDAPSAAAVPGQDELADRILAAWLGRCAGCNLGKPVEGWGWNRAKLRDYLHEAGAFPLDDYLPVLDPMPERFTLNPCWTVATRGRVAAMALLAGIDRLPPAWRTRVTTPRGVCVPALEGVSLCDLADELIGGAGA
jgi:hypothetical protein